MANRKQKSSRRKQIRRWQKAKVIDKKEKTIKREEAQLAKIALRKAIEKERLAATAEILKVPPPLPNKILALSDNLPVSLGVVVVPEKNSGSGLALLSLLSRLQILPGPIMWPPQKAKKDYSASDIVDIFSEGEANGTTNFRLLPAFPVFGGEEKEKDPQKKEASAQTSKKEGSGPAEHD